jgi:hypothetical protein
VKFSSYNGGVFVELEGLVETGVTIFLMYEKRFR